MTAADETPAQGLFNVLILGLGPIASNYLAPLIGESMKSPDGSYDFRLIFTVPMVGAIIASSLLLLAFWPPKSQTGEANMAEKEKDQTPLH